MQLDFERSYMNPRARDRQEVGGEKKFVVIESLWIELHAPLCHCVVT
jgi:hypothetical protein